MKLFIRCLPGFLVLGLSSQVFSQNRVAPPNIILIVADDLGYGDPGCYGQQLIRTPNIDLLAAEGMRFTQFYAGTTVCAPSRASLMTGLHTGHTAVRGNREYKPEGQFPLPDSSVTIAQVLRDGGYSTAAFGKWGLGYPGSSGEPLKKGFSDFYGYNCQALAHDYYPDHLWQNDQRIELPGNLTADSVYAADLIHRHAMRYLDEHLANAGMTGSRPFFVFLAYTLPHASLHGPSDSLYHYYVRLFGEKPLPNPGSALVGSGGTNGSGHVTRVRKTGGYTFEPYPHAAYAAMVDRLDHYVGDILQKVRESGEAGNTLILFTSDNGPHQEGGGDPAFFHSSGIYRGIKRDLYEGGIRVPFIAAWKGRIKPGSTSAYPGAFWDLFPTFRELAGASLPAGVSGSAPQTDGVSLLPVWKGTGAPRRKQNYLYWEFHENGGRQAIRWGKWKGVRQQVSIATNPPLELYDLEKDPGEERNLAAQHPDIVDSLNRFMREAHRYNKDWPLLKEELAAISK